MSGALLRRAKLAPESQTGGPRVQRLAWQRWLEVRRRVSAELEPALARVWGRRAELGSVLALAVFFLIAGGLSPPVALLGLAAVAAWAVLRPSEEADAYARTGTAGPSTAGGDRLWHMVVDAVPEPAVVLDHTGYVVHANRMAEDLFGSRRRGGHVASMSRDPELLEAVDQALVSGATCSVELHERVPVERRLLATVAPLDQSRSSADGPALLISFRDLSDQDRLARMRADFVANASHELRTPLASLRGFVETLQGAAKDDTQARERFLKVMGEQAERMTRLIDDLLSLSRVEMREHLTPAERVDLNEAVAHVIQSLQPIAGQTGATIEFRRLEEPAIVRGDSDEIVQVFQNLVQNAIKYGKPGGRIDVGITREPAGRGRPARFVASVTDDGPGIAPQHLPRLTERFYRVSVAASREKGGTGLGLAIVKHILNRHRGELDVTSRVGQGSTFSVILPAQD
jgi:two-component system, OmpR family, phosphate regulon sensor histidine kinase PhoR